MRLRLISPWKWVTVASVILMFFVPFFGLLSRAAKIYRAAMTFFAASSLARHVDDAVHRGLSVDVRHACRRCRSASGTSACCCSTSARGACATSSFMDAFPRMRVTLMTSPYRDEVQVPVNPETMEPLPAHE